jgi:hypothetical protein
MPGAIPHPLSAGAFYNLPLSDITETTSTCGDTRVIYATPTQLCATSQRSATLEGLCAPPGSPESSVTRVVGRHMLLRKFCDKEALDDDQTEDHQELGWNDAVVTFDTVIDFSQLTKYFDPMDADTDSDYISDSRDDLFDGVDRTRAFDNDCDLDMHEPGD